MLTSMKQATPASKGVIGIASAILFALPVFQASATSAQCPLSALLSGQFRGCSFEAAAK